MKPCLPGYIRAVLTALCATFGMGATAAVLHVDPFAPGPERDGRSWSTAYTGIRDALSAAGSGDEVHVADGAYEESITLQDGVVLRGGFAGFSDPEAPRDPGRHVALLLGSGFGPLVSAPAGVGTSAVLEGFSLGAGASIAVYCASGSPTIARNVFLQVGTGVLAGTGSAPRVWNNSFLQCETGLRSLDSFPDAFGNLFLANATGIRLSDSGGTLGNNSVVWCGSGVSLTRSSPTLDNTVFAFNEVALSAVTSVPAARNNLVFENGTDYQGLPDPTGADGNLRADPRFANASADDYRLLEGSPAVDTGRNDAVRTTIDLDGRPRIVGTAVDIGAYEFAPAPLPSVAEALEVAGGLKAADPDSAARLDTEPASPSTGVVDLMDALRNAISRPE